MDTIEEVEEFVEELYISKNSMPPSIKSQVMAALSPHGEKFLVRDQETGRFDTQEETPSWCDLVGSILFLGWKLLLALCPPSDWCGGWPCFMCSLVIIGAVTAIVGEFAELFGCVIGLKDSVTAISIVALGTSLPDTFASMQAAQDNGADDAIGNVTGSNAVNVFLGLGVPWAVSAVYYTSKGQTFKQPAGPLATSVLTFSLTAIVCILTFIMRRKMGGELGGSRFGKRLTFAWFVMLWLVYIVISTLVAYEVLDPL